MDTVISALDERQHMLEESYSTAKSSILDLMQILAFELHDTISMYQQYETLNENYPHQSIEKCSNTIHCLQKILDQLVELNPNMDQAYSDKKTFLHQINT